MTELRPRSAYDVAVIGCGISGAATAYELAKEGHHVLLLDQYGPAAMGSGWTLAGVRQSGRHPAELPMAQQAVAIWQTLSEELEAETHYRQGGNMRMALDDDECRTVDEIVATQSALGLDIRALESNREVREICPLVSDRVLRATYCTSDGSADPVATVHAYLEAARRRGVTTKFGCKVTGIEIEDEAVTGLRVDGEVLPVGKVVVATGALYTELLDPIGIRIPLHVLTSTVIRTSPLPTRLAPVISFVSGKCAGRQEVDGSFRVTGGPRTWDQRALVAPGADLPQIRPTAGSLAEVIETFAAVIPAIRDLELATSWAGLIDKTPDLLPVLDADTGIDGLILAIGFSGHGFGLGPATGRLMADLAAGRTPDLDLSAFRSARFNQPVPVEHGPILEG